MPDSAGRFGRFGGRFAPETLMPALEELERVWADARQDQEFQARLIDYLREYAGRPTPLYRADRLSAEAGLTVYLKREDLCHTGAHKINNTIGQALLAQRMGKRRVIAETGAGQHGVATATAAALFGLECDVYMGEEDIRRQRLNVFRMRQLGARVVPVSSGSKTLKDATNEAMRDWVGSVRDTHYIIGSTVGPHPFPMLVRDLQAVIGEETRRQSMMLAGRLPDACVACVGGGSNSLGMFHAFIDDEDVALVGVEAAGYGLDSGKHGAPLARGTVGVLHGSMSYLLQDDDGQVIEAHSVSAGLDYPGVGPEHAYLKETGRVLYAAATDDEALDAYAWLGRTEGILPALESAHALAYLRRVSDEMPELGLHEASIVVVCLSGRGDKDVEQVAELTGSRVRRAGTRGR